MVNHKFLSLALLSFGLLGPTSSQAAIGAAQKKSLEKPVRTLISAVRYGKDDLAIKQLAGASQGEALLPEAWKGASPKDKGLFVERFHGLFAALAFPKLRANFEHLETIVYDKHEQKGGRASLESTLVILHPLKKQEIKVRYDLVKTSKGWQVLDVGILGAGRPSMLIGIRDEQVNPLLEEGGLSGLLAQMQLRLEQVRQK